MVKYPWTSSCCSDWTGHSSALLGSPSSPLCPRLASMRQLKSSSSGMSLIWERFVSHSECGIDYVACCDDKFSLLRDHHNGRLYVYFGRHKGTHYRSRVTLYGLRTWYSHDNIADSHLCFALHRNSAQLRASSFRGLWGNIRKSWIYVAKVKKMCITI